MRKLVRQSAVVGLEPGELVHVGERKPQRPRITAIRYDEERFEEAELDISREVFSVGGGAGVTWLNVIGVAEQEVLERIGASCGLHGLVLEDIMNTDQRVKVEDFGDYLYIVVRAIDYEEESGSIASEQISLVLGANFVVAFQESDPDLFASIQQRLASGKSRARAHGPDFLAYLLLDAVVDRYFVGLEKLGDEVELTEAEVAENPSSELLQRIHRLKRELIFLRKSTWPLREVVGALERRETPLISDEIQPYLRDLYDHTIQIIDTVEALRDITSGMLDIYLSSISNRLNVVMKLLAIIGTIFMPLTFIAGLYGMNFRYMPELGWRWGYPVVLLVMAVTAAWMVYAFRKKGWM